MLRRRHSIRLDTLPRIGARIGARVGRRNVSQAVLFFGCERIRMLGQGGVGEEGETEQLLHVHTLEPS